MPHCSECTYWQASEHGWRGHCHCIYADRWNTNTRPTDGCKEAADYDPTLDSRQEVSWTIRR